MRKWISTLLIVSLVASMAAMLNACGKSQKESAQTTEPNTQLFADEEPRSENAWDNFLNNLDDTDDESYSYTERTTDEHYQEEYDALTLPVAVTTQPVAGTTRAATTTNAAVRETTTQFQFTYAPRPASTTAANAKAEASASGQTTAAASTGTTKQAAAEQTGVSDTTVMSTPIPEAGIPIQDPVPVSRPQVTYLDKYVSDILDTNNYTMQTEMKTDGVSLPVTTYVNGDSVAFEMSISQYFAQKMELPISLSNVGKIRMILKNMSSSKPQAYLVLPTGYIDISSEGEDGLAEFADELKKGIDVREMLQLDRLTYCGITNGVGYVCETYEVPGENITYNFYFTKTDTYEGLVRYDAVDLNTKQVAMSASAQITKGVSNSKAFNVSGKQISVDELEKMFS